MARHCKAFPITSSSFPRPAHRGDLGRLLGLLLVCGSVWTGRARAYEDQASLDLAVGGLLTAGAETLAQGGPEIAAGGAIGLSDMFVLRAQLGYAPLFESGTVQQTGRARVEAAYLLDVLKVVPFFGLGANLWLYRSTRDDTFEVRPGGHLLVGADYLWSRTWTLGLDVRIGMVFEPSHVASATEAQFRLSRMFDLF